MIDYRGHFEEWVRKKKKLGESYKFSFLKNGKLKVYYKFPQQRRWELYPYEDISDMWEAWKEAIKVLLKNVEVNANDGTDVMIPLGEYLKKRDEE